MNYAHLGRTGLKVSRLCLGTMNFGPQTNEKDSFAIMDKALESGINFFDTWNNLFVKVKLSMSGVVILLPGTLPRPMVLPLSVISWG